MFRSEWLKPISKANCEAEFRLARFAACMLLGAAELAAQSSPGVPAPALAGQSPAPERQIVVSIPDRKLALLENGRVVKVYGVAVGRSDTPSPAGIFFVADRVKNPVYYHPGVVIPPGRENPVGTRWLGLSRRGYGIHGTDDPASIGHFASHGCIRLRNRDIEDLFSRVRIGDEIEIHSTPDSVTRALFHSDELREPVLAAASYAAVVSQ